MAADTTSKRKGTFLEELGKKVEMIFDWQSFE
jgi:hypothetical protein